MLSQLIQRQVPIGSQVKFSLKNGREIIGILIEIGRDHITVQRDGGSATVLVDMIGGWEVLEGALPVSDERPAESPEARVISAIQPIEQPGEAPREPSLPASEVAQEALKRMLKIEAHFEARLQAAKIEVKPPDFALPADEFKGSRKLEAKTIWDRIKNRYEYAARVNELGAVFGRLQSIIVDLNTLSDWFPTSPSVKRHLAYLHSLAGNRQEALKFCKDAALASGKGLDWYNLAVLALNDGQEALACYGLGRFFQEASLVEEQDAWYVYVRLLVKLAGHSALATWLESNKRSFSEEEQAVLLETAAYLLHVAKQEAVATKLVRKWLEGQPPVELAVQAVRRFQEPPHETFQQLISEIEIKREDKKKRAAFHQPQGHIFKYLAHQNYGFLEGVDKQTYFFHRTAVTDDELLDKIAKLRSGERIPVVFETAQGPKGPLAVGVSLYRTVDEMFELAVRYADNGDYPQAIAQVRKVLALDPEYPAARESYERWREYARATGVPRGSNPYARAKRVQLVEQDLERAVQLFRVAIEQGDNAESAVKDMAQLLAQLGRPQEAIEFLRRNRKKIRDQQSVDNLLVGFYQSAGQYDQAVALLEQKLKQAPTEAKKIQLLWQIANSYLRQEDYAQAERAFREVLRFQRDNKAAQRNIAACLFKQQRFDEAENILNRILDTSPDAQAAELLEAIRQAKETGLSAQIDEIIVETTLSDFSSEISGFTQFFLERSKLKGVPPDRVQTRQFRPSDIKQLEDLATQLGTRRPRDRADYYLSAAKIVSFLEDDPGQFYRYLCRSFASMGDASVIEGRPLDVARELYCESLAVYDGARGQHSDEQDAVNALVRFLFATLGHSYIPIKPKIPSIDETIENICTLHPQRDKVFDAVTYLVSRSRYANQRLLNRLYAKATLQAMALEYLEGRGITVVRPVKNLHDFAGLWNELRRKNFDKLRAISNELRFLNRVELTTASLEGSVERVKRLEDRLFFDLDQQRIRQFRQILETALDLCRQQTFEEQERLCIQIESRCQDLLKEIEDNPTRLSVEELYSVITAFRKKVGIWLENLYQSSAPQLSLRLPVESYTPGTHRQIEVQITVVNRLGCSPAESLELVVQPDEDLFSPGIPEIRLDGSLRGGDQRILRVPMGISEQALRSQTFSLPLYAQYRTRSGDIARTSIHNFSIRLYPESEFREIENPYAAYAEGGVVGDPAMFYGREGLIENVARAIRVSRAQSKCVVIFGQKRAGKSSILYHLKNKLQADGELLVLDLGNIGSILDEHAAAPFLYQILWSILRRLEYAIEDRVSCGATPLGLRLPDTKEFYEHPSPLVFFKEAFERFKREAAKHQDWQGTRVVLLIDEFSYIHGQIVSGRIPGSFMKNWKALLQENFFSAVLAGQDVMPKFKQQFPNEFGTTQDERVSYLRREDAIRLIDEPIRIGGRQGETRYRERAIERILDLTAGSPFYIQIICNRLVEYMNRKRARLITDADVEQVKNELIRGVNALGSDKFENLINSGDTSADAISDRDAFQVLKSIAMSSQTGPCSRSSITCETRTPVDVILKDLVDREVLEQERESYYRIRVGLFKEWLQAH